MVDMRKRLAKGETHAVMPLDMGKHRAREIERSPWRFEEFRRVGKTPAMMVAKLLDAIVNATIRHAVGGQHQRRIRQIRKLRERRQVVAQRIAIRRRLASSTNTGGTLDWRP